MKNFKFIDLFAGLGGFRIALESLGGECIFSSEINPHACAIYEANFNENPFCDITTLDPAIIPDFQVLCAGFPCQAFSIAGKKKGFEDTRGTLFFDICRIIEYKRPCVIVLENVKNLTIHDNGNTFQTIVSSLEKLNYYVSFKLLSAKDFGIPQHRQRIIIVAIDKKNYKEKFDFDLLKLQSGSICMRDVLQLQHEEIIHTEYTLLDCNIVKLQESGLIFCGYRNKNPRLAGVKDNTLHLSRTHKQPNRIYHINGVHPTISSQETSGRYFVYDGTKVFKLNISECFRLMGFPENYIKTGSQSNLYNRIGNSVCIPMIKGVMQSILKQIDI